MTLRDLVQTICTAEKWSAKPAESGWEMVIPQPKGRFQTVRATLFKEGKSDMVRYTSTVGTKDALDGTRTVTALELNAKLPHGCLALDGRSLVLTATRPLATTTAETSSQVIKYIAKQADSYERLIYSKDEH